jgi:hypothetical protein
MERGAQERRWFWATLVLSSITLVAVVFATWELVEYRFFREANYVTLHYLYITRGKKQKAKSIRVGKTLPAGHS